MNAPEKSHEGRPKPIHGRAQDIFMEVAELPPEQRDGAVLSMCGDDPALVAEIRELLGALARAGNFLSEPTADRFDSIAPTSLADGIATGPSSDAAGRKGMVIDRYKLLQPIGEGGFGVVWMADQFEPVKRRIALKVIKLGMDTKQVIGRFEAERQALALMDHSNIAKVLDAGTTDSGRPYFVMEYIRGVPLLEYCESHDLDTRARLGLFIPICRAIQHAHQKGVIHRDIKPSNVLVTMHDGIPVPKVIDFGIAKATGIELTNRTVFTEHRQMIGTPAYMSPEQAEMSGLDIDTRSDVYSLGVLLYETLTGTTPFNTKQLLTRGLSEMLRVIREERPAKPSTRVSSFLTGPEASAGTRGTGDLRRLNALLRGDLDWVVMKCLEKERSRRYDSAAGLADDISRYLGRQPVLAGPPTAAYRLRKFTQRHRRAVSLGIGIAVSLLIATTLSVNFGLDATRQRQMTEAALLERDAALEAERGRLREIEQVAEFQAIQLESIDLPSMAEHLKASLLAATSDTLPDEYMDAIDRVNFTDIALDTYMVEVIQPSLDAIDQRFADQPLVQARLLQSMGSVLNVYGFLEDSIAVQRRALAIRREHLGDEHTDTIGSINWLGLHLYTRGDLAEAAVSFREGLDLTRRVLGPDHADTFAAATSMGLLMQQLGKPRDAEVYLREAAEGFNRVMGENHQDTLISMSNLASVLRSLGRYEEALRIQRETYDKHSALQGPFGGPDGLSTLVSLDGIGQSLLGLGRYAEAEKALHASYQGRRLALGTDHIRTYESLRRLSAALR
ncbi:MAG: serine/threonine-protein kinase, partial [Planctomycetota bacterium]